MKYYILLSTLFFVVTFSFCQERVVINNDVYITMDVGTGSTPIYLILDSPNANAMTTAGTGGNLVSENEYNKVRWYIEGATGNYEVPYTTGTETIDVVKGDNVFIYDKNHLSRGLYMLLISNDVEKNTHKVMNYSTSPLKSFFVLDCLMFKSIISNIL
jgi:hypothetical protein